MKYRDLLDILLNPANSLVEFKRDDINPEKLAKEIVAFANFRGGQVFLGVDDTTRKIIGLSRENCEEWVMDTVFGRYITPSIIPLYEEINTPDGKKVAVISVEQGTLKPYAVKDHDKENIFIRIGSISKTATKDQIVRMSQEAGHYHFEIAPVSGSSIDDLDKELFVSFYRENYGEVAEDDGLQQLLNQYDLVAENSLGKTTCSIAGLVLFGKNPGRYLLQHGIRVVHYRGNDISLDHVSDKLFTSCLGRISKGNELLRSGLIDQVMQHLSEKLAAEVIGDDGVGRFTRWQLPEGVLRELIVNSVIHRDYTRNGRNEIRLFNDRIEVESQGRLPNTLTVEKIIAGQKYPRNPIMVQHAQYFGLMEHKGLGVRKIVIEALAKSGFRKPELIETDDSFKVVVYFKTNS